MAEALIAGGALIIVALVGLTGTIIQLSRKNTREHEVNGVRSDTILDHIVDLHGKVDHVGEQVISNGNHTRAVEAKVDTVASKLDAHVQLHEGA
jgi:hypothetical protein